jgi:hypothetical protein
MLRRAGAVAGLSLAVVVAGAGTAIAGDPWGTADCSQNPYPGCELGAGNGGQHSAPSHGGGGSSGRGSDNGGSGGGGGGGSDGGNFNPNPNLNCSYQRSDYKPPPGVANAAYVKPPTRRAPVAVAAVFHPGKQSAAVPIADPNSGQPGSWYVYKCSGNGVHDAFYRPPVWIPNGPQQGGRAQLPSPAQLAQVAHNQLRLPSPRIEANPAGEQLVNLPTWLWLDRGGWGPVSATASVPGVSVTATARPTSVTWAMGDGSTVTCKGPGTPYGASGSPKSSSPTCGYTYHSSSAGQPGQAYAVSATVHWTVTWSGAGQTGAFPDMTTTSNAAFRVAESQALNSGS